MVQDKNNWPALFKVEVKEPENLPTTAAHRTKVRHLCRCKLVPSDDTALHA